MSTLDELEAKYQGALNVMHALNVGVSFMSLRDDKLYIKALAPSEDAKNKIWDEIKKIDATYKDLICDIIIDPAAGSVTQPAPQPAPSMKTYTVKQGDTLSRIALLHYKDASKYPLIAEANKALISDPDKIRPGMILNIPEVEV